MIAFNDDSTEQKIKQLLAKQEEDLAQLLSNRFGLGYTDLTVVGINTDALRLIPEAKSREAQAAAFDLTDRKLKIAIKHPNNDALNAVLEDLKKQNYETLLYTTSTASLEKAWKEYASLSYAEETKGGSLEIANHDVTELLKSMHSMADVQEETNKLLAERKGFRTSRILEIVMAGALVLKASDIHLEPEEGNVHVRYRLDGVLTNVVVIDTNIYKLLLSRVKLLSGLKLNVHQESQDGRFSVKLPTGDIEIRTSILPGAYNESIVLRLLNPETIGVKMEELGIPAKLQVLLEKYINKPEGMILTTGPTGSGKTTTLYAFLKKVHEPGVKIITIEDPIEYHLPGIVQTQVNEKGYNFLEGLRAALRQDPDIIMVGEIRDAETAKIAVNSAQTGHLVFTTLHTNSAAGAFPRLVDLDVNPKTLMAALNLTLAQRLVRRLCSCRKEVPLTDQHPAHKTIQRVLETFPKDQIPENKGVIYEPNGCELCGNTGYKGRIGLYEAIYKDETIEGLVANEASEYEIKRAARSQGMMTLLEHGVTRVLEGTTSYEELARVIDVDVD